MKSTLSNTIYGNIQYLKGIMHSVRQFELVKALATYRHFGRAAAALGVSQPALTRSLKHLEDILGVPLFDLKGSRGRRVSGISV